MLRDRSNGTRGQAAAGMYATCVPVMARPFRVARQTPGRLEYANRPRFASRAGLERSPLHDVRQHALSGLIRTYANLVHFWTSRAQSWQSSEGAILGDVLKQSVLRGPPPWQTRKIHPLTPLNSSRQGISSNLVEPDGIEPTTSCLQSRRSPN